jgi:hypothetical protein
LSLPVSKGYARPKKILSYSLPNVQPLPQTSSTRRLFAIVSPSRNARRGGGAADFHELHSLALPRLF